MLVGERRVTNSASGGRGTTLQTLLVGERRVTNSASGGTTLQTLLVGR